MKIFENYLFNKVTPLSILKNILILSSLVLPTQTIATANVEEISNIEKNATHEIISITKKNMLAKAKIGVLMLDANGCAMAKLSVFCSIPKNLKVGIFKKFVDDPASNGYGKIKNDTEVGGLGMSIKLRAVLDSKNGNHDFTLVRHPVFFVRNSTEYFEFPKSITAENPAQFFFPGFTPLKFRLHGFFIVNEMKSMGDANPLETQYWSMTPYRLGRSAIKFSQRSCEQMMMPQPKSLSPGFMGGNRLQALTQRAACLDVMVKIPTDISKMPKEDPIEWKEQVSPFITVFRISIQQQNFNSAQQRALCERLSFTLRDANPEPSPLGGIKLVRKAVYETFTRVRQDVNGQDENDLKRFNLSPSNRFY